MPMKQSILLKHNDIKLIKRLVQQHQRNNIPGNAEELIMLDRTLFSHQSALYAGTHGVRDDSSGLFALIAGSLGAVCGLRAPFVVKVLPEET